jgi:hypothetical protein
MATTADASPLFEGRFAEIHNRYRQLSPVQRQNDGYRYHHYNFCYFASLCRDLPGDFVCAGVAFGATAKVVYEYVDFPALAKKFHLIDPFDATAEDGRIAASYHSDPDYVRRQYPSDAPIIIHRERIPMSLPGPLAFVMTDTGVAPATAAALPGFYEALSPGGIIVCSEFNRDSKRFLAVLDTLRVTAFWLPSGQCVIFKNHRSAGTAGLEPVAVPLRTECTN